MFCTTFAGKETFNVSNLIPTTWQVGTLSRGTREKRIRPGTPSRTPDLFLDYVGGRFVPASVRRRTSRRSESGKLRSSRSRRGGETGINVSDFQVHVFDLSPGVIAAAGARR